MKRYAINNKNKKLAEVTKITYTNTLFTDKVFIQLTFRDGTYINVDVSFQSLAKAEKFANKNILTEPEWVNKHPEFFI